MSKTLIVVPTHNEAANIGPLLDGIAAHVPDADVLVVDDASVDGTRERVAAIAAQRPNVRLVERPSRLGLGTAYVVGFEAALDAGHDLVVEIDADLSHDPAALPTMLAIADLGIPVVIGSRYVPGGAVSGWPRRRIWLSRWGNRYAAVLLGLAINDATAGYRVYRTDALRTIGIGGIKADGYGFQIEMTYRAVRKGLGVVEVPIQFRDRVAGASKMNRRIVFEAFRLVTTWALTDILSLRRRRRAYRSEAAAATSHSTSS